MASKPSVKALDDIAVMARSLQNLAQCIAGVERDLHDMAASRGQRLHFSKIEARARLLRQTAVLIDEIAIALDAKVDVG